MIIIWQSHLGFGGRSARSTMKGKCYWVTLLTQNISSLISKPLPNEIKVTIEIYVSEVLSIIEKDCSITLFQWPVEGYKTLEFGNRKRAQAWSQHHHELWHFGTRQHGVNQAHLEANNIHFQYQNIEGARCVGQLLAGLWIAANKMLLFSQETENTTYLCPIRFYNFPLDTQVY